MRLVWSALCLCLCLTSCGKSGGCAGEQAGANTVPSDGSPTQLRIDPSQRHQVIDGFGTSGASDEAWYADLYFDDLRASILRMDITPRFRAPYSDNSYNSPWFHNSPPLPGPDGNNVRTYRDARDYGREWNGRKAEIAVLGPNLEQNLEVLDFDEPGVQRAGLLAQRGFRSKAQLGDFKLIASLWSPAPWLKRTSGSVYGESSDIMPKPGTPFPFIWAGSFGGGVLDTSDVALDVFDDSARGGTGKTSALTQFARGIASFLLGFQRKFGVPFHAISIQNELGFEVFYHSCAYLRAEHYVAALKAVRRELDRHAELRHVQIIGPEDLLGEDGYTMWQYGDDEKGTAKNLKFMAAVAADNEAAKALAWFAVHGYAQDGSHAADNHPTSWRMWTDGWQQAPASGLPDAVKGTRAYGKKSWMTETSGEPARWSSEAGASPGDSALGIASRIHNALTVGEQSAWLYWLLADAKPVNPETLTDQTLGARSPKYVAAKHFFRFIRPGSRRVGIHKAGNPASLLASAFLHEANRQLTVVLINPGSSSLHVVLDGLQLTPQLQVEVFRSTADSLWQPVQPAQARPVPLDLPAQSVTTLHVSPRQGP